MWQRIRNRILSGVVLLTGVLAVAAVGIGFLGAGAYMALAARIDPAAAALLVGFGALALVGLALGVVLRPSPPRRAVRASSANQPTTAAPNADQLTRAGASLAQSVTANPRQAMLVAFGIGVALGVSPRARQQLYSLIAGATG
jgi:hypothetical protein